MILFLKAIKLFNPLTKKINTMKINKNKLNFAIDALMFLSLLMIAGLGLLIKYVLIPGQERWIVYGKNVDMTFLGLDRHQWGSIHLIVAIIFSILLLIHLVLHWKSIICSFKRFFQNGKIRKPIAVVFIILSMFLLLLPFLINVEEQEALTGKERFGPFYQTKNTTSSANISDKTLTEDLHNKNLYKKRQNSEIQIRGHMTLSGISHDYNIPADTLKNRLELPSNTSENMRLGHLKKQYNFTMSDIENIINHYKKE